MEKKQPKKAGNRIIAFEVHTPRARVSGLPFIAFILGVILAILIMK